ncbi:MAG: hypothetical protein PHE48_05005 [Candidatus Daviesbacteria bacterium]|nr:hypothetical protein [Candidatus Daviesbacteria bacterium]
MASLSVEGLSGVVGRVVGTMGSGLNGMFPDKERDDYNRMIFDGSDDEDVERFLRRVAPPPLISVLAIPCQRLVSRLRRHFE